MKIDLSRKVAIVTGVGKGIGQRLATTFALEGATTIMVDVSQLDLDAAVEDHRTQGHISHAYALDIRDQGQVRAMVDDVVDKHGRVDILVNNAGVGGNGLIEELAEEEWDLCFDVNVKGVYNTCKAVIPHMKRQRWGRIINAASFAAVVPMIGSAAYAASKSAVVQFSRALAGELGPWDITVNSYAPGMVPTTLNHFTERPDDEQERLLDTLTLRRWGTKDEVAQLVAFLASDLASYITGEMIEVSGGKLATQMPQLAYELAGRRTGTEMDQ